MKNTQTKTKENVNFIKLSNFEFKFNYKDLNFILQENNRGVYGSGRSVGLYQLNGVKKDFIVSVGWTKSDGEPNFKNDLIKEITSWEKIKKEAIEYINKLID